MPSACRRLGMHFRPPSPAPIKLQCNSTLAMPVNPARIVNLHPGLHTTSNHHCHDASLSAYTRTCTCLPRMADPMARGSKPAFRSGVAGLSPVAALQLSARADPSEPFSRIPVGYRGCNFAPKPQSHHNPNPCRVSPDRWIKHLLPVFGTCPLLLRRFLLSIVVSDGTQAASLFDCDPACLFALAR